MMQQRLSAGRPHSQPPPFTIRPARPDDEAALTQLLTDSYGTLLAGEYGAHVLAKAVPVIGQARPELLREPGYMVAEADDGLLIGAGGWTWNGPAGGAAPIDWGHVRHVACAPAFAGQGIGRLILSHVIDHARASGVRVFSCLSTLSARGFYARMGFADQGEIALTLGAGLEFPAVQMRRVL